jgi:hypothetical protein
MKAMFLDAKTPVEAPPQTGQGIGIDDWAPEEFEHRRTPNRARVTKAPALGFDDPLPHYLPHHGRSQDSPHRSKDRPERVEAAIEHEDEPATGLEHSVNLNEGTLKIGCVVKYADGVDSVEAPIVEGKVLGVGNAKGRRRVERLACVYLFLRELDRFGREIDSCVAMAPLDDSLGIQSLAASHFEHAPSLEKGAFENREQIGIGVAKSEALGCQPIGAGATGIRIPEFNAPLLEGQVSIRHGSDSSR